MPKTVTKRTPRTGKPAAPTKAAKEVKTPYTKMTAEERARVRKEEIAATLRRRDEAAKALQAREWPKPPPAPPKPPSLASKGMGALKTIARKHKVTATIVGLTGLALYGADKVEEAQKPARARPASSPAPTQSNASKPPAKPESKKKTGIYGRP